MKKTAIILTTFNRVSTTINCLKSIKNNTLFNSSFFDIYIADSNSKDQTVKKIKNLNSEIKIFNVGDNIYWSQGMNLAWFKAHESYDYDFYIWLNDDTILDAKALEIIFKDYYNVLKNSILVGVTSDKKGNITYGGRSSAEGEIICPNNHTQRVKYINGNFVLIPKNVFNKVGFLDKKYSHALGDIDYGLRAIKNGISIFITSKIIGKCLRNSNRSYKVLCKTLYKEKNLIKRIKKLNEPLIMPFKEYYYFNRKYFGIFKAIKFIFGYILLIIFPLIYFKLKPKI